MQKEILTAIFEELEELDKLFNLAETEFVKRRLADAIEEIIWEVIDEKHLRVEVKKLSIEIGKFRYTRKTKDLKKELKTLLERMKEVIAKKCA